MEALIAWEVTEDYEIIKVWFLPVVVNLLFRSHQVKVEDVSYQVRFQSEFPTSTLKRREKQADQVFVRACVGNDFENESMSVDLGPIAPAYPMGPLVPSPFAYNPRCLTRDLSPFIASQFQKESLIIDLITQSPDIAAFQNNLQGDPPRGIMALHPAGHLVFGGDPSVVRKIKPSEIFF